MKVAIYSLTRERAFYTQKCFESLKQKAGYPYDHYIVDNGSKDQTVEWLQKNESEFKKVIYLPENVGIYKAANKIRKRILKEPYDLVIKFDNDCFVVSDNVLATIVEVFKALRAKKIAHHYILSPRVEGLFHPPKRVKRVDLVGHRFGVTRIIGGIFRVVPADVYRQYNYPETLPKARGGDGHFCSWFTRRRGTLGYLEDLEIQHYETTAGQAKRYKEYFKRKKVEEREVPK